MAPINDPINAAFSFFFRENDILANFRGKHSPQTLLLIVLAIRKVIAWSADFSKYDLSFCMSAAVCFLSLTT